MYRDQRVGNEGFPHPGFDKNSSLALRIHSTDGCGAAWRLLLNRREHLNRRVYLNRWPQHNQPGASPVSHS
ncbi:MAG: hypothetical protein U5K99_09300 [Anaerolineales bacterium]|nr:hypothetical protein [Anaerolineales bacterium]